MRSSVESATSQKGFHSWDHFKWVHIPVPFPTAVRIPVAKAAADNELNNWDKYHRLARIESCCKDVFQKRATQPCTSHPSGASVT